VQPEDLPALDHRQRPAVEKDVFADHRAGVGMLGDPVAAEVVSPAR
jgi:hypothetical protein